MAHVKQELKVEHSPDLFHVQQELSRATAAPLSAQEKEFETLAKKAKKQLEKASARNSEGSFSDNRSQTQLQMQQT